jgi:hypothetical protein
LECLTAPTAALTCQQQQQQQAAAAVVVQLHLACGYKPMLPPMPAAVCWPAYPLQQAAGQASPYQLQQQGVLTVLRAQWQRQTVLGCLACQVACRYLQVIA